MESRRTKTTFIILTTLFLVTIASEAGVRYRFRIRGNFPGANYTVPFGIGSNHIVGYYSAPGVLNSYVQTGNKFLSVVPFGSVTSYLFSINRSGLAIGGYCVPGCNPSTGERAYTYDYTAGVITSIDFPGSASTTGYGINDLGQIVGGYCSTSIVCPNGLFFPTDHAFLDDNGVFTTLDFPGADATQAFGINRAGIIVGIYDINLTGPHTFLYQNGIYTNIDFPGANFTVGSAINNNGVVAGYFQDTNGVVHGFLYSRGSFTQIDVPGALATGLSAINDSDDLVGVMFPPIGSQPFIGVPVH